jgi:hypothetical protein
MPQGNFVYSLNARGGGYLTHAIPSRLGACNGSADLYIRGAANTSGFRGGAYRSTKSKKIRQFLDHVRRGNNNCRVGVYSLA